MSSTSMIFEGILDEYFEKILEDHPTYATYSGLKSGEGKLGSAHPEFEARQERRRLATLKKLGAVNPSELSGEQHLDRLALRSQLTRECEDYQSRKHSMDPSAIDGLLSLLLHELQRSEDEPARAAANIRSILKKTPAHLAEAVTLIDRPEPVWRRLLGQTLKGVPSLFAAVSDVLKRVKPCSVDAGSVASAIKACEQYHRQVMERPEAPAGSFCIGAETMGRRVRDQLGLDYTLQEIESLAIAETGRLNALLSKECRRFGLKKTAEQIITEAREDWNPGPDLLNLYQQETRRVAEVFRDREVVTFPKNESLDVRLVPEFMRHLYPTAAYSSPGPFARKQRGIFWVNDLSLTKTSPIEKRAERQQHFGLSLTCAHEAYPGHHLQFITANQHPRRWRRLFAHAVFYEGWTLWCEHLMVQLKVDPSPWLRVQQLHDALWRAHRVLVDLRLQTGRYTYEQGVKHLQKFLHFTPARAAADINWYTSSPTVPMSYWLGRLENERLRQRLMVGRGWPLKQFNDWLLSFGTLPQAWIEKYGLR